MTPYTILLALFISLAGALSLLRDRHREKKPCRVQIIGATALAMALVGALLPLTASVTPWLQVASCILGGIAVTLGVIEYRREHPASDQAPR